MALCRLPVMLLRSRLLRLMVVRAWSFSLRILRKHEDCSRAGRAARQG